MNFDNFDLHSNSFWKAWIEVIKTYKILISIFDKYKTFKNIDLLSLITLF